MVSNTFREVWWLCSPAGEHSAIWHTVQDTPTEVHLFGNFILAFKSQWMEEATASLITAQGLRIQQWLSSGKKKRKQKPKKNTVE